MTRQPTIDRAQVVVEMDRLESGILLAALAELPFKTVYALIGKVNARAHGHFSDPSQHAKRKPFEFEIHELAFCAQTLESLPYREVHALLERVHRACEPGKR